MKREMENGRPRPWLDLLSTDPKPSKYTASFLPSSKLVLVFFPSSGQNSCCLVCVWLQSILKEISILLYRNLFWVLPFLYLECRETSETPKTKVNQKLFKIERCELFNSIMVK